MFPLFLAGLIFAFSLPTTLWGFPMPPASWLAWIGFAPLYLALQDLKWARAFWKGLAFGAGYFGLSLYWMAIALHHYGEVPLITSLAALGGAVLIESFFWGVGAALFVLLSRQGTKRPWAFIVSFLLLEFMRSKFPFGGFPWSQPAYSQSGFTTLIQILDITGVYGPLLLILWANALCAEILLWLRSRAGISALPRGLAVGFAAAFFGAVLYGHFRLEQIEGTVSSSPILKVALIQGNIPQEEKWIEEKMDDIIDRQIALSLEAEKSHPDVIFWPEAAYPAVIPPEWEKIEILEKVKTPIVMGGVTYKGALPEDWPPDPEDPGFSLYNGAVLVRPGGVIDDWYFKNHLVPMGEYVPFGRLFSFLHQIVPSWSSFTPGNELRLMDVKGRFGVTICYEDLFPEINRTFTRNGADYLVNLTNDAWYDRSSAVFQHVDFSRYRAIENRRAVVRATNTGVTALFSPTGKSLAQLPAFEEGILSGEIPLVELRTIYTRLGDWMVWLAVLGAVVLFVLARAKGTRHEQGT